MLFIIRRSCSVRDCGPLCVIGVSSIVFAALDGALHICLPDRIRVCRGSGIRILVVKVVAPPHGRSTRFEHGTRTRHTIRASREDMDS